MKVYEIIATQQQLEEAWYNPLSWVSSAPTAAQTALDTKGLSVMARYAKAKGLSPGVTAALTKMSQNAASVGTAEAGAKLGTMVGKWFYVLKLLGCWAICIELYNNLTQLEKLYMAGDIDSKNYKEAHEAYWGLWTIQMMLPWLTQILRIEKLVAFLIRMIVFIGTAGLAGLSAGVTGGVSIVGAISGMVVEQAVFTAVQAFVMSKAFENWLTAHFFKGLVTIGTVEEEGVSMLRDLVGLKGVGFSYDKEKAKRDAANPAAAKKEKEYDAATKAALAQDQKNAVVINGVRVDDGQGGIDQLVAAGPMVQGYVGTHPEDPMVQKYLKMKGSKSAYSA